MRGVLLIVYKCTGVVDTVPTVLSSELLTWLYVCCWPKHVDFWQIRNQYNVDNLALTIEVHLHPDLKPVLDIVTAQGAQIVNLYRQQVPACQPYACRAYACCQPYIQIRTYQYICMCYVWTHASVWVVACVRERELYVLLTVLCMRPLFSTDHQWKEEWCPTPSNYRPAHYLASHLRPSSATSRESDFKCVCPFYSGGCVKWRACWETTCTRWCWRTWSKTTSDLYFKPNISPRVFNHSSYSVSYQRERWFVWLSVWTVLVRV